MKVCICEKPSVAKDIAKVLGATSSKDGYYEGNGYQVTWTFGHLCGLKMPEEYDPRWKKWNFSSLPIIPARFKIKVMENAGVQKQFNIIKSLVDNAEEVINCGDAGQEGELIQRWVLHLCKVSCPVKRLWISSLTEDSIRKGFENLRPNEEFELLYNAGMARSIGDWLLGINSTRYYTIRSGGYGNLKSVGRVQTPTLAMVVERDKEIEKFESSEFYNLSTIVKGVKFLNSKKFADKKEVDNILKEIKEENFVVKEVKETLKSEKPPKLFDLTSLQVYCNNVFGYSAEVTLNGLQNLYEKKLTTYPRVDTCYLTNDIYKDCSRILNQLKSGYEYIKQLDINNLEKRKTVFDDTKVTDHHAIIPTGRFDFTLNEVEGNIFDTIVKRFICVFFPDFKYNESIIVGEVKDVDFKASGRIVKQEGFYEVLGGAPQDVTIPDFAEGEVLPHKPKVDKKNTSAPQHFTEATLLRAMETAGKTLEDKELKDAMKENGIGRPSTRASIIELLINRGYIVRDKKKLISTTTGRNLIQSIDEEVLKSAKLTGEWENKLRKIERGEYDAKTFLDEMKSQVRSIIFKNN